MELPNARHSTLRPAVPALNWRHTMRRSIFPLWLKLTWTSYAALVISIYWQHYGPKNFLWFSDIAFFGSVIAMWLESPLLASMLADGVIIPELFWNVGFFTRLITGRNAAGLSDYMFDPTRSLTLRGLSLFHVAIPFLLLWMVKRLGYRRKALAYQTVAGLTILTLTYLLTKPKDNINWVYGPGTNPQQLMPPLIYLTVVLVFFPTAFYWPTHALLKRFFENESGSIARTIEPLVLPN